MLTAKRLSQTSIARTCITLSMIALPHLVWAAVPNAVDDTRQRTAGFDLVINVLDNDTDADGDSLTVTAVGGANGGDVSVSPDNRSIEYKPFDDFNSNDQFTYTISDGNGGSDTATVFIQFREVTLPEFAQSNNQRTLAGALDSFCRYLDEQQANLNESQLNILARCEALFQLAASGQSELVALALQQIAPEEIASQTDTTLGFVKGQGANIEQRLTELKLRGPQISAAGLSLTFDGQTIPGELLQSLLQANIRGGSAGDGSSDPFEKLGFFINGNFETGDREASINESAYDWEASGVTLGADYRLTSKAVIGVAYGLSSNEVDFENNGGLTETDSSSIIMFGTYYYEQYYVDAYLGYGWGDFNGFRNIVYRESTETDSIFSAAARSQTDHSQVFFSLSSSMDINKGPMTISPYSSLDYAKTDIDGFQETNGNGWEIKFNDRSTTSFRSAIGSRANYVINSRNYVFIPQGRLAWIHEFKDSADVSTATFANDPLNNEFDITSDSQDKDYFQVAVGASIVYTGGVSAFFEYETNLGWDKFTDNHYYFGIRYEAAF